MSIVFASQFASHIKRAEIDPIHANRGARSFHQLSLGDWQLPVLNQPKAQLQSDPLINRLQSIRKGTWGCSAKVPHTPKYYYNFHRIRWQHEPNGQESCWGTLMLQSTPYTTLPCVPGADVSLLSTASLQTSNGMRLSHVLKFPKRNPSTWKYRVQTDTAILRRLTWPHVWFTKSPPADEHDEGVSMHTPKTRDSCLPTLLSSHRQNNLGENTNL